MHKKQFTETEIDPLRGLFQEKEIANRAKQKNIRAKMRKIGFYITDYADNMNLSEFGSDDSKIDNPKRAELIKIIYASNDEQIELFYKIIKAISD